MAVFQGSIPTLKSNSASIFACCKVNPYVLELLQKVSVVSKQHWEKGLRRVRWQTGMGRTWIKKKIYLLTQQRTIQAA